MLYVFLPVLYHPYPKTYPKFVPKDMVADFLEAYALGQNLVLWTSSTVLSDPAPKYDEASGKWTVSVKRTVKTVDGRKLCRTLHVICLTAEHAS
jgi:cation diffusion facilitator CzcD-associated flavoprotein CzcO